MRGDWFVFIDKTGSGPGEVEMGGSEPWVSGKELLEGKEQFLRVFDPGMTREVVVEKCGPERRCSEYFWGH